MREIQGHPKPAATFHLVESSSSTGPAATIPVNPRADDAGDWQPMPPWNNVSGTDMLQPLSGGKAPDKSAESPLAVHMWHEGDEVHITIGGGGVEALPTALRLKISTFLDLQDRAHMLQTSRSMHALLADPRFAEFKDKLQALIESRNDGTVESLELRAQALKVTSRRYLEWSDNALSMAGAVCCCVFPLVALVVLSTSESVRHANGEEAHIGGAGIAAICVGVAMTLFWCTCARMLCLGPSIAAEGRGVQRLAEQQQRRENDFHRDYAAVNWESKVLGLPDVQAHAGAPGSVTLHVENPDGSFEPLERAEGKHDMTG